MGRVYNGTFMTSGSQFNEKTSTIKQQVSEIGKNCCLICLNNPIQSWEEAYKIRIPYYRTKILMKTLFIFQI